MASFSYQGIMKVSPALVKSKSCTYNGTAPKPQAATYGNCRL